MEDAAAAIEYDMFPDGPGWTIFNVKTHEPALVKGVRQTQLPLDDADDLVDLLNAMERAAPGSSVTWADGSH
ncbi:hypothetical protein [Methylobacterium sp. E-045]|uniref:hypothetical protein n=1 Tax=Methylobacterium sp. E-045 TaxID=2836575 RepID=UPI001FBBA8AC|nr:hypothetical protein [Methylobacterium sp. E-045]MCJ2129260.1 hypothetical protein [Methylobacterium sp. E-045]